MGRELVASQFAMLRNFSQGGSRANWRVLASQPQTHQPPADEARQAEVSHHDSPVHHRQANGSRHCFILSTYDPLQNPFGGRSRSRSPAFPFTMFSVARQSVLRQARTQLRLAQPAAVPQFSALSRLLSTLAILEQRDGKLNVASLAAVTAGAKLGGSVTGFVAGSGVKAVAEEAAKVKGIEKIIYVENGAYDKVGGVTAAMNVIRVF